MYVGMVLVAEFTEEEEEIITGPPIIMGLWPMIILIIIIK
jgi:hypothetical protein